MELTTVRFTGPRYPHTLLERLRYTNDRPEQLWLRGNPDVLHRPSIAIVGSRAATGYGLWVTQDFVNEFVRHGYTIVSGAAYGIDGEAHRAALAAGGSTIAYFAGGLNRPYPVGHQDLINAIADSGNGALLSEYGPDEPPTRQHFLDRNRLIGAHAEALVVIEAGYRSGSLNAARQAAALGVPVFAVPGPVTSAASMGTNGLIKDGGARLAATAADVIIGLGGKAHS